MSKRQPGKVGPRPSDIEAALTIYRGSALQSGAVFVEVSQELDSPYHAGTLLGKAIHALACAFAAEHPGKTRDGAVDLIQEGVADALEKSIRDRSTGH